ncbi:hypothetical protein [Bacillus cereus]|uniref:hypothetical protein n=1 Tax=Bacillus cereus TaxID=1396 RepID=UPI000BF66BB5|nr:hypothetical protein [Bacillus cereus]PFB64425.1 hypothetical protein CN291_17235 [Bacillus cereus]
MSNLYPIKDVYIHPEIMNDIVGIAQTMTPEQFHEFYFGAFKKAIDDAKADPFLPNTQLEYKLFGWSRLDFHSVMKPPRRMKRDYRFIYKYEPDTQDFYQLAVGPRNAKGHAGTSIYYTAQVRPKTPGVWKKETE